MSKSRGDGVARVTVGIVGVGLIGGSIGMACKGNGHRVIGYDPRPDHIAKAIERHCLDEGMTLAEVAGADAIFVAVPPASVKETLAALSGHLGPESALTDCTSVKSELLAWASAQGSPLAEQFVGGHPMAGHEKSGPAYASAWMFRGARWILTPTKRTSRDVRDRISGLIKEMGATPVKIDAEAHDRHVAVLSHLPHVVAAALIEMSEGIDQPEVAAGSWRDLTRVAGVDPDLWSQILVGNAAQTSQAIDDLISGLEVFKGRLNNSNELRASLAHVATVKESQTKAKAAK